jgi:cytosine/adenosine deaminase-related metal-dependent hydrolase
VHDPVATVIMQAGRGDIETVMIAGRLMKRAGKLVAARLDAKLAELGASGRRIVRELHERSSAA